MSKIADLMLMASAGAASGGGGGILDLEFIESRYGATMGSVNVYVVNTFGNIQGSAVYSASGDDGQNGGWSSRTGSAVDVSGTFRVAWHYVSGSSYTGDYAIDNVSIQNTTYNFTSSSDGWITDGSNTSSSTAALSGASGLSTTTTGGLFVRRGTSTPSGSTGPNNDLNAGSSFAYAETSTQSAGFPSRNFWLFSPEITA